jgi:hypothetical protein
MKHTLIILFCIFLFGCRDKPSSKDEVLICGSKSAYAYHSHRCKGLSRCGSEVKKMSLPDAKKQGYKACGFCYGK